MYEEDSENYRKQPEEYRCSECGEWYPRDMVGKNNEGRIVCEFCIENYPEELAEEYHYF